MDLAYNKLEANREKDQQFLVESFEQGLFKPDEVRAFIENHAVTPDVRKMLLANLSAVVDPTK
jgi:hypothetical protein